MRHSGDCGHSASWVSQLAWAAPVRIAYGGPLRVGQCPAGSTRLAIGERLLAYLVGGRSRSPDPIELPPGRGRYPRPVPAAAIVGYGIPPIP